MNCVHGVEPFNYCKACADMKCSHGVGIFKHCIDCSPVIDKASPSDDFERTVEFLLMDTETDKPLTALGLYVRQRAAKHLSDRMYLEICGPKVDPSSPEMVARDMLKGAEMPLRQASDALHAAADKLNRAGQALAANTAKRAAIEAAKAAESFATVTA